MTRTFTTSAALAAIAALSSCAEVPTAVVSPKLSVRSAKPVKTPPSGITVTALGTLTYDGGRRSGDEGIALALNNGVSRSATRVGGWTKYNSNPYHPFTWTQETGIAALSVIESRPGWVQGVSDNGVLVGEINTSTSVLPFSVTADGPMSYLPVPSGNSGSATGINADGSCVSGHVSDGAAGQAVIWRSGVLEIVGSGGAQGVSDDCLTVVGSTQGGAATWRNVGGTWTVELLPARGPGSTFIGPVRNTEVMDVSPSGEYISGRRTDSASVSAVVWRRTTSGWVVTDMPAPSSYAFGVDDSGRAVGVGLDQPMVWTRSLAGVYSGQVLPSLSRTTRGAALAINELGQIAGRSTNRDGVQPVMWTLPAP